MDAAQALRAPMYTDHFGLQGEPFRVTPDPKFFFAGPDYRLLAATLLASLDQPEGICLLSGPAGSGKTLLLRQLISDLDPQVPTALLWNANLEYPDFLAAVTSQLSEDLPDGLSAQPMVTIELCARQALAEGRHPVLVVDEAHGLPDSVIEHMPELADLRIDGRQALALVLAVEDTCRAQLTERLGPELVGSELVVEPMDPEQVRSYVLHRLRVAGYHGPGLFTDAALDRLSQVAGGVPRLVNMIAGKSLFLAYLGNEPQVGAELVDEVAGELWRPVGEPPHALVESSLLDLLATDSGATAVLPGAGTGAAETRQVPPRPVPGQRFRDLRASSTAGVPAPRPAHHRWQLALPRPRAMISLLAVGVALSLATEPGREWLERIASPLIVELQQRVGDKVGVRPESADGPAVPERPLQPTPAEPLPEAQSSDPASPMAEAEVPVPPPEVPEPLAVVPEPPVVAAEPSAPAEEGPAPEPVAEAEEPVPAMSPAPQESDVAAEEPALDPALVGREIERTRMIRALLSLAVEYLNADRYIEPAGANAYQSYLDVLELDPGNAAARAGIEALQARLLRYARVAERREDWDTAARYYRGALTIDPLSDSLRSDLARAESLAGSRR